MAVRYYEYTRIEHFSSQSNEKKHKKTSEERIEIRMKILQERKEAFNVLAEY